LTQAVVVVVAAVAATVLLLLLKLPPPLLLMHKNYTITNEQQVLALLPTSLRQPDIEFGHFKRLLKAFLFGETAAH